MSPNPNPELNKLRITLVRNTLRDALSTRRFLFLSADMFFFFVSSINIHLHNNIFGSGLVQIIILPNNNGRAHWHRSPKEVADTRANTHSHMHPNTNTHGRPSDNNNRLCRISAIQSQTYRSATVSHRRCIVHFVMKYSFVFCPSPYFSALRFVSLHASNSQIKKSINKRMS